MANKPRRIKLFFRGKKKWVFKIASVLVTACVLFYIFGERNGTISTSRNLYKFVAENDLETEWGENVHVDNIKAQGKDLGKPLAIHEMTSTNGNEREFINQSMHKDLNLKTNDSLRNDSVMGDIEVKKQDLKTTFRKHRNFLAPSPDGEKALKEIMEQLEKDKLDTYEVDLNKTNPSNETKFPPFVAYGNHDDPGEHGLPFVIPKNSLTKKQRNERRKAFNINRFDLWASQRVALHRRLDDKRRKRCRDRVYDVSTFPLCSVVIVFCREAWTTLLRTVHSILDRTSKATLLEIILLDDASNQDHLKTPLEVYLKPLKIVRLIRATKRLGLIKARNLGFLYAKGEIIIFLDSHVECFPGWLEPLVAPIVLDPKTVTYPVIPVIDKTTFGIDRVTDAFVGSLNIQSLSFSWQLQPGHTTKQLYVRSPTMPGGLYAISKSWFRHLGAYDHQLKFWGGENLEISFKVWMCGGKILKTSCSWIGHVFRNKSPYHPGEYGNSLRLNSLRVAEVWMDQYKHFYYEKINYRIDPFGNTSLQTRLRNGNQCQNFKWFLDNVNQPLRFQMDVDGIYFGLITNMGTDQCLVKFDTYRLLTTACDSMSHDQMWQFHTVGYLLSGDMVMMSTVRKDGISLGMSYFKWDETKDFAIFHYDEHQRLVHQMSHRCLDVNLTSATSERRVILFPCGDSPSQKWKLQTRKELQAFHKDRGLSYIKW